MCVIAVCEKRRLTRREVVLMDAANPHGIGIAWADKKAGRVEYVKGLDVEAAVALLPNLPLPHVVHFRFASVGGVDPSLTHPFPILPLPDAGLKGKAKAVLFHNGTWGNWRTGFGAVKEIGVVASDASEAGWSDSRVMAALMAAYAPKAVAEIVGPSQRLVVLHAHGRLETFGAFERHQGLRVSNLWWWTMRAREEEKKPVEKKPSAKVRKAAALPTKREQLVLREMGCDYAATWTPERFKGARVPRPTWPARGRR